MNNNLIAFWNMLDRMLETHKIIVDRPQNTPHPKYSEYISTRLWIFGRNYVFRWRRY